MRRLCALTFGLCLIAFLFQGRLEQRIFIGLLDYILIAAMDAIVLFGASTVLRISLDELVWKKGMMKNCFLLSAMKPNSILMDSDLKPRRRL